MRWFWSVLPMMVVFFWSTAGTGGVTGTPPPPLWDCSCGQDRSCDIHPMIQAIIDSHRDCICDGESTCSCPLHPMVGALVESYREASVTFTDRQCVEHPMIRELLAAYGKCDQEPGCGCCEHPMIRAVLDCWRDCAGKGAGTPATP